MTDPTPTPPTPGAPEPTNLPAATATAPAAPTAPTTPAPGDPAAGFKSEESKAAVLADLAKERDARQALEARLDAQNKAFAEALGVTPTDKAADPIEMVETLRKEIADDRRAAQIDRLVAAHGVNEEDVQYLQSETDPEKLKALAVRLGAAAAVQQAASATPAFQANPGQGQGGASTKSDADRNYEALFGAES